MSKNNDTTQAFLETEAALEKALADQGRLENEVMTKVHQFAYNIKIR
ncbi:MAG: hypothetical protein QF503_02205 [Rhodospirillales bacterium]|nr:hypothetical protein [Rhodospirillales bacterium]